MFDLTNYYKHLIIILNEISGCAKVKILYNLLSVIQWYDCISTTFSWKSFLATFTEATPLLTKNMKRVHVNWNRHNTYYRLINRCMCISEISSVLKQQYDVWWGIVRRKDNFNAELNSLQCTPTDNKLFPYPFGEWDLLSNCGSINNRIMSRFSTMNCDLLCFSFTFDVMQSPTKAPLFGAVVNQGQQNKAWLCTAAFHSLPALLRK